MTSTRFSWPMRELVSGTFGDETRSTVILQRLVTDQSVDGLILGGTELPLLLPEASISGAPLLNTTRIHVEAWR